MFSVLWLLYLSLISVLVAFVTALFFLFLRKERLQDLTPTQSKIEHLKQHVPPSSSTGWQLKSVDSGLRVWQKNMEKSSPSWMPETIYACSGIIPASQQEVIDVLKQPKLTTEWDPRVKAVSEATMATHSNVISLSFNCTSLIPRLVHQIKETLGGDINAVYSRHWEVDSKPNSDAWFMSSLTEQVAPAEGALWSFFLVSSMDNGDDNETDSLVTLVTAPTSPLFTSIPQLTASRVAGLQDFFTHYKPDTSLAYESQASVTNTVTHYNPDMSPAKVCKSQASDAMTVSSSGRDDHEHLMDHKMASSGLEQRIAESADSSYLPDFANSQRIENLLLRLNTVYEGTEGTDGWITVGNTKGVNILKRPAKVGERPWDCLKGTSVISVPIKYILAYIYSLDCRAEWDDLFLKGEDVQQYDPITKVSRMEYKPQWPASGRDFCLLFILRQLSEGVFCLASESVKHENCPEQKGLVRGEVIISGIVIKELSSDPPSCLVTYITRVDLMGNLPAWLVNKVTSSQPQAVAILRDKLEALYQADLASSSQSQIQREGNDLFSELMKANEARLPSAEEEAERMEEEAALGCSLAEEQLDIDNSQSFSDADSKLEDSEEMFPISDDNMQLPFVDRHIIDFRTLGAQSVANLLGEVLLANQVDISTPKEFTDIMIAQREWSYQSTEKGVAFYRKINPEGKISSFLGKGLIKVKPSAVWQVVRNYKTCHLFDKLLKKVQLVREIDDQSKILYMHHEAKQCILKQSRDSLLLMSERVESEKYVLAAVSVELPELPPSPDTVRTKVYTGGWIIEPVLRNGQLYSMVSYLVQIDVGGAIPTMLMNLVARRQPHCVAYLRDYLEKLQD